jgi:hypothetical protein
MKLFFQRFLNEGFCANFWIWFHILAGGGGAKILMMLFRFRPLHAFLIVFGCAIIWEVCEFSIHSVKVIYGSYSRWAFDTAGDIIGAVIAAAIVVL